MASEQGIKVPKIYTKKQFYVSVSVANMEFNQTNIVFFASTSKNATNKNYPVSIVYYTLPMSLWRFKSTLHKSHLITVYSANL